MCASNDLSRFVPALNEQKYFYVIYVRHQHTINDRPSPSEMLSDCEKMKSADACWLWSIQVIRWNDRHTRKCTHTTKADRQSERTNKHMTKVIFGERIRQRNQFRWIDRTHCSCSKINNGIAPITGLVGSHVRAYKLQPRNASKTRNGEQTPSVWRINTSQITKKTAEYPLLLNVYLNFTIAHIHSRDNRATSCDIYVYI